MWGGVQRSRFVSLPKTLPLNSCVQEAIGAIIARHRPAARLERTLGVWVAGSFFGSVDLSAAPIRFGDVNAGRIDEISLKNQNSIRCGNPTELRQTRNVIKRDLTTPLAEVHTFVRQVAKEV